jgi:hypothetical protein
MHYRLLLVWVTFFSIKSNAQAPNIEWQKYFGGDVYTNTKWSDPFL